MRDYVPEAETIHHTVDPVSFPPAIEKLLLIALALVLLVPCFWQSHLQAGDFSSHIYNAWLTLEAEKGSVTGLETRWQWTNTLADLFLPRLLQWTGRAATERIASGIAVELFF